MRIAALLLTLVLVPAGTALAATPAPHATGAFSKKVPLTLHQAGGQSLHHMTGQGCNASHINAAQVANNPTTGKPRAAPIIQIPLSKGNGGVAGATSRAQNAHACAQSRAR